MLYGMQLSMLTDKATSPCVAAVHGASFRHDKFIKQPMSESFFQELHKMCGDPSRTVCAWLPGGHVWAMLMRSSLQTEAVVAAVNDTLLSQQRPDSH
jgi:hypothetical protein